MTLKRLCLALAILWAASPAAATQPLEIWGHAEVIDGDTIAIDGQKVRLHGIDAFELDQMCSSTNPRQQWNCGEASAKFLKQIVIASRPVRCDVLGIDRYQRYIGQCFVDDRDMGAQMVGTGLAVAYRRYSTDYIGQELAAREGKWGAWAGTFVKPWEWRRLNR